VGLGGGPKNKLINIIIIIIINEISKKGISSQMSTF
jgi:hypothetical protein